MSFRRSIPVILGNNRFQWISLIFLLLIGTSSLYLLTFHQEINYQKLEVPPDSADTDKLQFIYPVDKSNINDLNNYTNVHLKRIKRIHDICRNKTLLYEAMYSGRNPTWYYYSRKYNFSYCNVPKVGSTFWTQIFMVLKRGATFARVAFKKARVAVQSSKGNFIVNFDSKLRQKSRSILVSRNPYSRLFSAYVDKFYLPILKINTTNSITTASVVSENISSCINDITFREFLDFAISTARRGGTLNRHWAPIFNLCRPCNVSPFILVKQESFAKDVQYYLKSVGVTKDEYNVIMKALNANRVESTVPGIITTMYKKQTLQECLGWYEIAKRLWISFQIQGFVDEKMPFPSDIFNTVEKVSNKTFFTDVLLDTIRMYSLSSIERTLQRHNALVNAYKNIPKTTIDGIQKVYKADFALFEYNTYPPTKRSKTRQTHV